MKITKWFYLGVPVLVGVGMLLASQPKENPRTNPGRIDFDDAASGCNGIPLVPDERQAVQNAIDNIRTPPPDSLSVKVNNRDTTIACADIANTLQKQLDSGKIEAETGSRTKKAHATTKCDNKPTTSGDQINISENVLGVVMANPARSPYLEGILVHESVHKIQDSATLANDARSEKEAWYAQMMYWDSVGFDTIPDNKKAWEECVGQWRDNEIRETDECRSVHYIGPSHTHEHYIHFDTTGGTVDDTLITYEMGESGYNSFGFGPTRISDAMFIENYFLLPPSHTLMLVCGGEPPLFMGHMYTLDMFDGAVVTPLDTFDFPGKFLFSMTCNETYSKYYFLDTLNQEIFTMQDIDGDSIPDLTVSVYASAFWPGFEPLLNMRGVDAGLHPVYGEGLCVNHFDVHFWDLTNPYRDILFLPDFNADNIADECLLVPRFEFLTFTPVIQVPLPWMGENAVMLHATWDHDIAVWTTDPMGEVLFEELGMTHMSVGVDAECMLIRPLMAEEYMLALDLQTGTKSQAEAVIDPTPQNVTICAFDLSTIWLRWDEVTGATSYNIYESENPMDFPPEPTYSTITNEIPIPSPIGEKLFYRVTAER
ncbi:hypothetical protein KKB28_00140 [bacterium]|nr:hypothetical protein [bacterium]